MPVSPGSFDDDTLPCWLKKSRTCRLQCASMDVLEGWTRPSVWFKITSDMPSTWTRVLAEQLFMTSIAHETIKFSSIVQDCVSWQQLICDLFRSRTLSI